MNQEREKQMAAEAAANLVEDGMTVGLGTGSTAVFALRRLGARVAGGLGIRGLPTSSQAEQLAREVGIPLLDFSEASSLDMTLDGADEFDPALNLIKGGGGALFREKIVAAASRRLIIFADHTKQVPCLGNFPLPIEVNPFGWQVVAGKLKDLCPRVVLRQSASGPFLTDNHGYILDCACGELSDPPALEAQLKRITGIVETGLFIEMAEMVCLGADGTVQQVKPQT